MSNRRWVFIIMAALLLLLTACSSGPQAMDGEDMVRSYTQISQEEAKQMMEQDGYIAIPGSSNPDHIADRLLLIDEDGVWERGTPESNLYRRAGMAKATLSVAGS